MQRLYKNYGKYKRVLLKRKIKIILAKCCLCYKCIDFKRLEKQSQEIVGKISQTERETIRVKISDISENDEKNIIKNLNPKLHINYAVHCTEYTIYHRCWIIKTLIRLIQLKIERPHTREYVGMI